MKFKHVLISGLLTVVAAVMLLTFVFPQTAEAGGHSQCWNVWCGNAAGSSTPVIFYGSHTDAVTQCGTTAACSQLNLSTAQSPYHATAVESCKSGHNVCR